MRDKIEAILRECPDHCIKQVGPLWQLRAGKHSGARENGETLARDLIAFWRSDPGPAIDALPEKQPVIDYHADRDGPEPDYKALYEAELKRNTHAEAPVEVEIPAFLNVPPADVTDILTGLGLNPSDSYERVDIALVNLLREAKSSAELARGYGGTFNGRSVVEWERKAQSTNESIRWNSGRKVEKI